MHTCVYTYIYIYKHVCSYIYIYIYTEREREIHINICMYIYICMCVYIYIYMSGGEHNKQNKPTRNTKHKWLSETARTDSRYIKTQATYEYTFNQ